MTWLRRKPKSCGAWDPPEGLGRDTHVCGRAKNHHGPHQCKCGATWVGSRRRRPSRARWPEDFE